MKIGKKNLLIFLISFLIVSGISSGVFLFGKSEGRKELPIIKKTVIEPKTSKLVEKRYFNITGTAKEVSVEDRVLTLAVGEEEMRIPIKEGTIIRSYNLSPGDLQDLLDQGKEPPIDIEFKDVGLGQKVSVFVTEQINGELIGENVFIHFQ